MRSAARLVALVGLVAASVAHASPATETEHVVEPGETLNGIANRAGVSRDAIIRANGLKAPYPLRAGQTLAIPRDGVPARRAIAARSAPAAAPGDYIVQPGETLGGIANRERVPRVLIAEANRLQPPYTLRAGQKLLIPRTRHHVVKPGETGFGVALDYGVSWKAIAVANGLEPDAPLQAGARLLIPTVLQSPEPSGAAAPAAPADTARFAWPLSGSIRRDFAARGSGSYHDGLDIVAPRGTAVRAVAGGTVIFAGDEPSQMGKLVVIDHGDGWHSAYGSLDKVTVKAGETAGKGERVGLVGDTSVTRRTELHFELRENGKPVDPMAYLPKR